MIFIPRVPLCTRDRTATRTRTLVDGLVLAREPASHTPSPEVQSRGHLRVLGPTRSLQRGGPAAACQTDSGRRRRRTARPALGERWAPRKCEVQPWPHGQRPNELPCALEERSEKGTRGRRAAKLSRGHRLTELLSLPGLRKNQSGRRTSKVIRQPRRRLPPRTRSVTASCTPSLSGDGAGVRELPGKSRGCAKCYVGLHSLTPREKKTQTRHSRARGQQR